MKTNLSSQIRLERIPRRYYAPQGEVEQATLTRSEKVYTRIFDTSTEGGEYLARHIARVIRLNVAEKNHCVMALGAGRSAHPVYECLARMVAEGELSMDKVIIFNLYEFLPISPDGPSTARLLQEILIDKVDIWPGNFHSWSADVTREHTFEACREYEKLIADCGGLDLVVCQIGASGELGLNEPGSLATGRTRVVLLNPEQRHEVQRQYQCDSCPDTAITLGLGNILAATRVQCMAWGENRAHVVAQAVEGPVTDTVPASYLQLHNHARIALDLGAADDLTRISHPWKVTSCEWTDKLTRRAIVWLCKQTGKPILKLTNKDYTDFGLGELIARFGSAYNVNIKVFNELQHTITGWPGGKPDADDTYRPERATPYPKRVVIFSPHPDDDVISMGGTIKRLVDQHHDVHVAYETSGNIAVGDEDMMRYFMMMDKLAPMFGFDVEGYNKLSEGVHELVAQKAQTGDIIDTPQVRAIKTMIRQAEATIACNHNGVHGDNIHFLRMPFYETGTIKKGELTRADIDRVKELLAGVKPNQIYVAGDLADPHGTHRICTDAVLAAIDEFKDEEWMQQCRVWMYRGAWAEWEIDHIEMAVPLSPEELRYKRQAILKHQSQMENAPFLGDDDRLFWQRAEERNRATAALYEKLGLAAYEAMEAFVEYKVNND